MTQREPPIIDMMPDGSFTQARAPGGGFAGRGFADRGAPGRGTPGRGASFEISGLAALGIAAAFTIALVAFFVWLLMWVVPVLVGVALLAYGARRVRRWWLGKSAAPPSVFGV